MLKEDVVNKVVEIRKEKEKMFFEYIVIKENYKKIEMEKEILIYEK